MFPNPRDPPDEELHAYLLSLAVLPLKVDEKLAQLNDDLKLDIRKTKFFELQWWLGIPSIKKPQLSDQQIEDAVIELIKQDVTQANGPNTVKEKLQDKLIMVPRHVFIGLVDCIQAIMKHHAPDGFDHHFPGHRKQIRHQALMSIGPFREISADGHEKLNRQALQMGDLSLPIYGYKDKWSGYLLKLCVLPDARKASTLGHVYLDLVSEFRGENFHIPL
ncbi:hypothetical protein P691DRAFT_786519 [Macrolepiota fuliginosa MF-IS2]|uniref:Uncharacterized protein n=1 Tax=Macrolepiota fuliginosa MF-IS2 TaxID=1400762 RepID=A0A9P5WWE2_9AGAR|nr:hypothetical protein P691DRAFT_786519 [Macrolepiota fuliginosa MF-IS2]